MSIIGIGLDAAKHVFQLHGVEAREQPVLRRRLGRKEVEPFFAKLPPSRIGLEACGAAHHWARVLRALGHAVVLLLPQYIKPAAAPAQERVKDFQNSSDVRLPPRERGD